MLSYTNLYMAKASLNELVGEWCYVPDHGYDPPQYHRYKILYIHDYNRKHKTVYFTIGETTSAAGRDWKDKMYDVQVFLCDIKQSKVFGIMFSEIIKREELSG